MRSLLRSGWRWLGGLLVLALVVRQVGGGPVLDGLRALDVPVLLLGAAIAVVTTVASAYRWHLVARELGVAIPLPHAVAACYRAQLLNTVLPGGVLGDVHRGVRHGRAAGAGDRSSIAGGDPSSIVGGDPSSIAGGDPSSIAGGDPSSGAGAIASGSDDGSRARPRRPSLVGRALRAVAWERVAGQVVQAGLAVLVLAVLPSPVRPALPWLVLAAVALAVLAVALLRRPPDGDAWWSRVARTVRDDVRLGLLVRRSWPGVVAASAVATTGYAATMVVAARAVGVEASLATLMPLVLVVLVAAGLPLNLAGWGPREGMAAWVFAAAGLGASAGVATAVAYGALVLVAQLPGLLVLATPVPDPARREPAHA